MSLTDDLNRNVHETIIKQSIGHFGRWQLKISILMALLKLPIAWFQLSIVFLAPPTQFWCKPPEDVEETAWISMGRRANATIRHERLNSGYCSMFSNTSTSCTDGYSYNKSVFHSTIVSEWDLVCGKQIYIDFVQISLMFGVLIGNVLFGALADRKGRKPILITCILFQSIFGILSAFAPHFWLFIAMRFLLAIFNGGTTVTSFVMCMESVGGKWRTIVPILYQIPFGFGNTLMALIAFYFRDWRTFQASLSILSALYVLYYWLIPESPRWLLATGQTEKAARVLRQATIFNSRPLEELEVTLTDLSNVAVARSVEKPAFSTLFQTKSLKKRTLLLCLNWTIVGISFYAFSQYLGQISGNIFFTVSCGGLIALPGTILCVFIVFRFGRRYTITFAHLFTALCFLLILVIPVGNFAHDWPRVLFAACGIIGMSISMPALYLFTGELFPTVLRNAGVGLTIMFSRIGSMIAPLIIALHEVAPYLPLVILCGAAIVEALLVLPLPETRGKSLPETVYDLEMANATPLKEVKKNAEYSQVATTDDVINN